jgi:hypothetical protein
VTRSLILILAVPLLMACSSEVGSSAKADVFSCDDVLREHRAFQEKALQQAKQFSAEMNLEGSGSETEAYPKLKDSERFLRFQAELEAEDNKFKVRMKECVKADNAAN